MGHYKVGSTELKCYALFILYGFLFLQSFFFGVGVGSASPVIFENSCQVAFFCMFVLALICFYFNVRGGVEKFNVIFHSKRIDYLLFFIAGGAFSPLIAFSGGQYGSFFIKHGVWNAIAILYVILAGMIGIVFGYYYRNYINPLKKGNSGFVADLEINSLEDDLMGWKDSAINFASHIANNVESNSMIFGVDAPWGTGKTSFINMCCDHWQKNDSKIIVCRFEPLRYLDDSNLVGVLIDEITRSIQDAAYIPAVAGIFKKYKGVLEKLSGSFFAGINVNDFGGDEGVQDIFDELNHCLRGANRKVVVVIDDFDRISVNSSKVIIMAVKKSLMLSNISYIFCYDSEKLLNSKDGFESVRDVGEFFEKFINIKISLVVNSTSIIDYLEKEYTEVAENNLLMDPKDFFNAREAVSKIIHICRGTEFHNYLPYIGDLRKIKRILNTVILFDIQNTQFNHVDVDIGDLVNLILIYLNYPQIFRKIYAAEMETQGFFTSNKREEYAKYTEKLDEGSRFLLNKIFNIEKRADDEMFNRTRARFNANLKTHLRLIVSMSKPSKKDSYSFYYSNYESFRSGVELDSIISLPEFSGSDRASTRMEFYRVVTNGCIHYSRVRTTEILAHLIDGSDHFSMIRLNGRQPHRDSIIENIVNILNNAGYGDNFSTRLRALTGAADEIGWRVFGEREYSGNGILDKLLGDQDVIAFYKLLLFRLYCSIETGLQVFNIHKAFARRDHDNPVLSGTTSELAITQMRELSQYIFKFFNQKFILPKVNLFNEVDRVDPVQILGSEEFDGGRGGLTDFVSAISCVKSDLLVFITFNLGSTNYSGPVTCGTYDPEGREDNHSISSCVGNYLLDCCFNPGIDEVNYIYFLDYLLINLQAEAGYGLSLSAVCKVITLEQLVGYWRANRERIVELNYVSSDRVVYTYNCILPYKDNLPAIFSALDYAADAK